MNPGLHGPELENVRFLFEFAARRHGAAVIRPDLFAELLHNWLAVKPAPPHLHIEKKARESGASERFGVAAYRQSPMKISAGFPGGMYFGPASIVRASCSRRTP